MRSISHTIYLRMIPISFDITIQICHLMSHLIFAASHYSFLINHLGWHENFTLRKWLSSILIRYLNLMFKFSLSLPTPLQRMLSFVFSFFSVSVYKVTFCLLVITIPSLFSLLRTPSIFGFFAELPTSSWTECTVRSTAYAPSNWVALKPCRTSL